MPKNLPNYRRLADFDLDNLAFALGTAVAFSIVYLLVAQGLRERSDTWLSGEAEVLAQVRPILPEITCTNE